MSTASKRSPVREDVAALRGIYETGHEDLIRRLDEVVKRLDQINGNVRRHDTWIAGREPLCVQSADNLKFLTSAVTTITTILAEQRGEGATKARMATLANMVVIALTAIGSAWAAVRVALATVR